MPIQNTQYGDGWTDRAYIDPHTGQAKSRFYYKRKPAKQKVLRSKMALQLSAYNSIVRDLQDVSNWLDEIGRTAPYSPDFYGGINPASKSTASALFIASLTFYGKCFSNAKGRRVKLDKSLLDTTYTATHEYFIDARNNYAAHGGVSNLENDELFFVTPNKKGSESLSQLFVVSNRVVHKQKNDMSVGKEAHTFKELVEHVLEKVKTKLDLIQSKIFEEEMNKLGFKSPGVSKSVRYEGV